MSPIKVLHGHPSPEELAAVLAVVSARAAANAARADETDQPSVWSDRARAMRRPQRPGPYAWRTSAWAN
ncbi:hypothetical protein ABIA33_005451 [Streptacidiphilus sp. MAP12-16]|uniref:acyl-CoA carboxylase subunit epsilon n=1 Tax=Streptacidiphilus sp. MAP12-16 TaxID=3156300 RepID=UPI003513F6AF